MYFPWSTNLTSFFRRSIEEVEDYLVEEGNEDVRVVVFLSTSSTKAEMFELWNGKRYEHKKYVNPLNVTPEGLANVLKDVRNFAPAGNYSMIVSAHGLGWKYKNRQQNVIPMMLRERLQTMTPSDIDPQQQIPMSRCFGGAQSYEQMDIEELAEGIEHAGMNMECIYFDACYMANVEVAYALRKVCDNFVASSTEILAYGYPYPNVMRNIMKDDYEGVCDGFYEFYSNYSIKSGTLCHVRTEYLYDLALEMKRINDIYAWDYQNNNKLQSLDGYTPSVFYDFDSYVDELCEDDDDYHAVKAIYDKAVPYKRATAKYFTAIDGNRQLPLNRFSGLSISDPASLASHKKTEWWKATH